MSLKNKVAIVTGGNSGIGQAIVLELARQGASTVIDYVAHPEATEALEREIAKLGTQCTGVEADVSKLGDLEKLVGAAVAKFGRLDIMVNNAGIETRTSVLDTTESQYDRGARGLADARQYGLLPRQRRHADAHAHCRSRARQA